MPVARVAHQEGSYRRLSLAPQLRGVIAAGVLLLGTVVGVHLFPLVTPPASDRGAMQTGEDPAYVWTIVTPDAGFAPRDGAGGAVLHGRAFLIGGWNPYDSVHFPLVTNNEVWSTVDGAEWALERANTFGTYAFNSTADWAGRHTAGVTVHEDQIWIMGGDATQKAYQPDVWRSPDGKNWSLASERAPWGARALHVAGSFAGYLWVVGGQKLPQQTGGEEGFYADVWRSKDGTDWERVAVEGASWDPRGMVDQLPVLHGRMWLIGGGTYDTPEVRTRTILNEIWSSSDGIRWTFHGNAPWAPRQYANVAAWDGRLWVFGGWDLQSNLNDTWQSEDGTRWTQVPTPWPPRHAASVFPLEDSLLLVAGNNMRSDVWRLQRVPPLE